MSLEEKRKKIDNIDEKLIELLNQRAKIVLQVKEEKRKSGQQIYIPAREKEVLERLENKKGVLSNKALQNIFREIISASRDLQTKLRVCYLGPEATFSHQAALNQFGSSANLTPLESIASVFKEVEKENYDFGVVPVENSTEGSVNITLDLLLETDLNIVSEIYLDISHNLLSNSSRESIKKIYSHPQALAQCRNYLQRNFTNTELTETGSTSKAASIASKEDGSGAIASELAAEMYKIKILEKNIQDKSNNMTRFLILGKANPVKTKKDKCSILFSVQHKAGALFEALRPFHENRINLTKIESRPSKERQWEYVFFVDFEGFIEDDNVKKSLEELKKHCIFVKVLGCYPTAK